MSRILDRNEEHIVRELEKGVKEKWKWTWLDDSTEITLPNSSEKVKCNYGEFIRKINTPGKATCTLCDKLMNYGNRGKACLKSHFLTEEHRRRVKLRRTNYVVQAGASSSSTPSTSATVASSSGPITYGIPPAHISADAARPEVAKPIVSVYNRVRNQEVSFLVLYLNHNYPISFYVIRLSF